MNNGDTDRETDSTTRTNQDIIRESSRGTSPSEQCSMVANTSRKREWSHGRRGTMASIAKESQENFQYMAEELEKMGCEFFGYVTGQSIKPSSAYISDVIILRDIQLRDQCLDVLREYGRSRRNGLFGFSEEGDHIHVIHDCSYTNRSCRDIWISQVKPNGS